MQAINQNWPYWLIAIFGVMNLIAFTIVTLKTQVGASLLKSVTSLFRLKADQQDHEQDVEVALVDSELQARATQDLREVHREAGYLKLLSQKDKYLYSFLDKKVDRVIQTQEATKQEVVGLRVDLKEGFSAAREDQKAVLNAIGQTNNLLKELTVMLARRQG